MTSPRLSFEHSEMPHTSSPYAAYASDPETSALLDACVGRIARRDGNDFVIESGHIHHIADWLRAAIANDEPWLKNVDEHGRPKKLLKFGSVDAILREADKAMIKAAQKLRSVKLVDGDEEFVEMLEVGYYVVQLLTPAALDQESAEMQHCIGGGGYDRNLDDGEHNYFSLRDQNGKPHVTIEVENGRLTQFQGKQNTFPVEKYRKLFVPFIKARHWHVDIPAGRLGYVVDIHGNWSSIYDLPVGLKVSGDLDLDGTDITSLPDDLEVEGTLRISDTKVAVLPKGLSVGRHLIMSRANITSLPEGLVIAGDLFLNETPITDLPADISVGGHLGLAGSLIKKLPDGMRVNGSLFLVGTPITVLPDGLSVRKHLMLTGSSITKLPAGLSVGGDLDLDVTPITDLPDGLRVGGDLNLCRTEISALPEDLKLGGRLMISESRLGAFQRNLTIGKTVDLRGSRVQALPADIGDDVLVYFRKSLFKDSCLFASEFRKKFGMQKTDNFQKVAGAVGSWIRHFRQGRNQLVSMWEHSS